MSSFVMAREKSQSCQVSQMLKGEPCCAGNRVCTGIPGDLYSNPGPALNGCVLLGMSLPLAEPFLDTKKRLDSVISDHVQKSQGETHHLCLLCIS